MVWNVLDSDFTYTSLVMWLKGPTPQLAFSMKTFSVYHCAAVQLLSHVQLFVAPWNKACQAPLSMEFPRQEYWSGLPFPSPAHLPDPRVDLPSNSALVVPLRWCGVQQTCSPYCMIVFWKASWRGSWVTAEPSLCGQVLDSGDRCRWCWIPGS